MVPRVTMSLYCDSRVLRIRTEIPFRSCSFGEYLSLWGILCLNKVQTIGPLLLESMQKSGNHKGLVDFLVLWW